MVSPRITRMEYGLLGIGVLAAVSAVAAPPLEKQLPSLTFGEGWAVQGKLGAYTKDSLFELIDGEAELYFPYGFQRCLTVDYAFKTEPKNKISIEIYEMGSPLDTFGVYSNYRDADTPETDLGAGGFIESTQAMFYKGRYFVKARLAGKPEQHGAALKACALALAKALPGDNAKPAELRLLQIENLVPQSGQYLAQSLLGYEFFKRGLQAEAAQDGNTARIFVVLEESPKAVTETLAKYVAYLTESKAAHQVQDMPGGGQRIAARDPLHKDLLLETAGSRLLGVTRFTGPAQGDALLGQLRKQAQTVSK